MTGKNGLPPLMIEPQEAIKLLPHSTTEEMHRAKALYEAYIEQVEANPNKSQWEFIRLLSFIYDTARIQGIREQKEKYKMSYTLSEKKLNGCKPKKKGDIRL